MLPYSLGPADEQLLLLEQTVTPRSVHFAVGALTAYVCIPVHLPLADLLRVLFRHVSVRDRDHASELAAPVIALKPVFASLASAQPARICPDPKDPQACKAWCEGFLAVVDRIPIGHEKRPALTLLTNLASLTDRLAPGAVDHVMKLGRDLEELQNIVRDNIPHYVTALHRRWAPRRKRAPQRGSRAESA